MTRIQSSRDIFLYKISFVVKYSFSIFQPISIKFYFKNNLYLVRATGCAGKPQNVILLHKLVLSNAIFHLNRRQHMAGCATSSNSTPNVSSAISTSHATIKSPGQNPERLYGATQDLFEILERVQNSRLDDQRCVLPPYFSQVSL